MNIVIHAVGRLKSGAESEVCDRYLDRLKKSGPALGLTLLPVMERGESRARDPDSRKSDEARELLAALDSQPSPTRLVLLDERGKALPSTEFAELIANERDDGCRSLVFALGGPDGHDRLLRQRADHVLSFGPATWPHGLARAMLAEQLYRAVTILSGHPYHRA